MPQSATLESTPATIPTPRTEQPQDPNAWVTRLGYGELRLALALSDMPRTQTAIDQTLGGYVRTTPPPAPRHLTPQGTRTINAWVAQGTQRAGGELALWKDAGLFRRADALTTPQWQAFARRFGGKHRLQVAAGMESYVRPVFDPIKVHLDITDRTRATARALAGRYDRTLETSENSTGQGGFLYKNVYTLHRHHAHMAALAYGMSLVSRIKGGYALV